MNNTGILREHFQKSKRDDVISVDFLSIWGGVNQVKLFLLMCLGK